MVAREAAGIEGADPTTPRSNLSGTCKPIRSGAWCGCPQPGRTIVAQPPASRSDEMDHPTAQTQRPEMHDGEDFVCPTCNCEIMLKHHGDPERMPQMGP